MPVVAGSLAMTAIKKDVDAIEYASYKIDLIKNITNTDAKEKLIRKPLNVYEYYSLPSFRFQSQ